MLKKILVISYIFPPIGGAGVQRTLKFVKYMRKYGYEPIVLTVEKGSVPLRDPSLLADIPDGLDVVKASTLEPSYGVKEFISNNKKSFYKKQLEKVARNILIPDPQVLWLPGLIGKVLEIKKSTKDLRLIYVSAPPFSTLVAAVITKKILKLPLVCDFRDEWVGFLHGSSWSGAGERQRLGSRLELLLEKSVIRNSDAVITASPGYVASFREKYGDRAADKTLCITNGFDPDDIPGDEDLEIYRDLFRPGKMNILYMGTLWRATSLTYFLKGLRGLDDPGDINLIIVGRITAQEEEVLDACKDISIKRAGPLPHDQALRLASRADVLLVTLSPIRGSEKIIPAKIFEYMALGKHILAVVPAGDTSSILKDYPGAMILDPEREVEISTGLAGMISKKASTGLPDVRVDMNEHTRDSKTRKLCEVFDRVVAGGCEGLDLAVPGDPEEHITIEQSHRKC